MDFYQILGVAPDSEEVVIHAAFKALMRKYHPDTSGNAAHLAKVQAINEAYAVLRDSLKRQAYDQRLGAGAGTAPPPPPPPPPPSQPFKRSPTGPQATAPATKGTGALRAIVVAGVVILIAIAKGANMQTPAADGTADAVEAMPEETMASDPMAALQGAWPSSAATTADEANRTLPAQAPPVSFDDIEVAVNAFDGTLSRSGLMGAVASSKNCRKKLDEAPTWLAADQCAAFDHAAAYLDAGVTSDGWAQRNPYFAFVDDNLTDTYTGLGVPKYVAVERVATIKRAVEPQLALVISARIRRETKGAPKPADEQNPDAIEPSEPGED
jgi:hypothetical protein